MPLLRLLVALAVLLMPLGMAGAGGSAAAAPHHPAAASPVEHGAHHPAGGDEDRQPERSAQCMMACAALPPAVGAVDARPALRGPALHLRLADRLDGLSPEAATPPPRFS